MNVRTPTPELAKHLRAIEEGNRRDREWMADERLDELVFLCEIVASHCTSAREAAWRRDQTLLGDHMRHAWEGLQAARSLFKALPTDASKERA
jgi:hypothetical protein